MEAKQPKCFVPECYNSVGVLFPKSETAKKNWLKALRLEHLELDSKSFVCLDHFGQNGEPALQPKPVTPASQMELQKEAARKNSIDYKPVPQNICRLCMVEGVEVSEHVYTKLNEKYTIAEAISVCIHPIKISPKDSLSKYICQSCILHLRDYLQFYETCIAMDKKQHNLRNQQLSDNASNDQDSEGSADMEYLHEEWLTEFDEDKENQEDIESEHIKSSSRKAPPVSDKLSELIDRTFKSQDDKDKEELLQVLEDNTREVQNTLESESDFSKEDGNIAESIVIEMENNDEEVGSASPKKVPITIKRVQNSLPVKRNISHEVNGQLTKRNRLSESGSTNNPQKTQSKKSSLGWYNSVVFKFLFNSEYIFAGGYLYDMRLTKGDTRRLHCIVNNCPGMAQQFKINSVGFSHRIQVIALHNHKCPDEPERKRQMFYDILYKKMRRDRFFNFKVLYEQFCKLDKSLADILPLSTVIKEICKQGPAPLPPSVNSFEEFHRLVDQDVFNKIHFTDNRAQFYREKFHTDDGGKAVAFGNEKVMRMYSNSKLMYVDASFYIESQVFPYQLVTVFLWVEESYYPVFYALINLKSQALYRQIFSYLYNEFPSLKPTEIVTEYEANLYYALSEVYTDSNIGGSIYYFAQNIYKKICSVGLSKDLEVNTNFRNVYNMLLMLPLLPSNTIVDCLDSVETQAKDLGVQHLTEEVFEHIRSEWINKVTPDFFGIHRMETRIVENIVAPMKKLRDLLLASKSKFAKTQSALSIVTTVEKLVELDRFLRNIYSTSARSAFTKDISSNHKRNILKTWNYIENYPNINTNQFFLKVLGYIKCMENQLWIWGLYQFTGKFEEHLIDAKVFAVPATDSQDNDEVEEASELAETVNAAAEEDDGEQTEIIEEYYIQEGGKIRRIQLRQPSNCSTQGYGDISEEDMELEIFGQDAESFS